MKISANSLEAAQRFSAASDIDILDTDADIYHHGRRSANPPEALGMVWGSPQEALENPWEDLGKLVGSLRALKRKRGFDGSTRSEPARARKDRKKEEKTQWWQAPSSSTRRELLPLYPPNPLASPRDADEEEREVSISHGRGRKESSSEGRGADAGYGHEGGSDVRGGDRGSFGL